ncbi:MAG TPA: chromate transporter [Gemmatimonadaceae bacterium]|nr:chromate transporter [Gemmatimonadaceae bacterium]
MSAPAFTRPAAPEAEGAPPSLGALVRYFLHLGTFVFGGPVVLVERMRRDLQENRGWFTEQEYRDGLALAQLAPGPLAAQLAIYLGWVSAGVTGATLVGAAFIVPSFLMVLALSAAYLRYGGLSWMRGAFYGIGAAVIALIVHSAWKLVRKTVGVDRLLWAIVIVNAALTAWSEREIVWVILFSGMLVLVVRAWPSKTLFAGAGSAAIALPAWWLTGMHGLAPAGLLTTITIFFAKAGAVVFGSGLAIVPYMHHGVVEEFRWLTEREFLDAVAVSMITPGPVVITVAFIGYLTAGPLGAIAAAIGVFLPTYLFVVLLARWYHRFSHNRQLRAVVDGITAGATGAIAGAAIVLGRRALIDVPTWLLFALAMALFVWSKRKVPEPLLILAAGVAGIAIQAAQAVPR